MTLAEKNRQNAAEDSILGVLNANESDIMRLQEINAELLAACRAAALFIVADVGRGMGRVELVSHPVVEQLRSAIQKAES